MTAAEAAARRLINTVRDAGATMTIISGGQSVTIGPERHEGNPMSTIFADQETGEIQDVKGSAVRGAQQLVEAIWRETAESYDLAPLTALAVAQKIANAVLSGTIKEHADILGEPFRPQQQKLPI